MAVSADGVAHGATPKFVAGHAVDFSGDVPQGDVDGRDGGGTHHAIAMPEMLPVHHLPQVLDACWVFADEQLGHILHRADDATRVPFQRALAPAKEARLTGEHLHKNPVAHARVADVGFDGGDFHCRRASIFLPTVSITVSKLPGAVMAMVS